MKSLVKIFFLAAIAVACNNNSEVSEDANKMDSSEVHPPSEAIPDSMQIVQDSAIVPEDSVARRNRADTLRR